VPQLGDAEPDETAVPQLGDAEPEGDAEPAPAEGDAPADADADPAEGEDADKPIDYQFEAPEGTTLREPVADAFKQVLQKHRVAPEVANDILQAMLPALKADTEAQWKEQVDTQAAEWRTQLQERHGDRLGDVMRLANRALLKGATPELTTFLRNSALAAHPDFIDLLAYFGQRVSNDRSVRKTEPSPKQSLDPIEAAAAEYETNAKKRGQ
jgi:hypothetical protein